MTGAIETAGGVPPWQPCGQTSIKVGSGHDCRCGGHEDPAGGSRRRVVERSGLGDALGFSDYHRRNRRRPAYRAYDESAARICGVLMGDRKEPGLPMSLSDGQVAAIARLVHLAVATRNVLGFEHCGIDVSNPFEAAASRKSGFDVEPTGRIAVSRTSRHAHVWRVIADGN